MPTSDNIIIGGISETTISYQLGMRGAANILHLEREVVAYGSSDRATGELA